MMIVYKLLKTKLSDFFHNKFLQSYPSTWANPVTKVVPYSALNSWNLLPSIRRLRIYKEKYFFQGTFKLKLNIFLNGMFCLCRLYGLYCRKWLYLVLSGPSHQQYVMWNILCILGFPNQLSKGRMSFNFQILG